MRRVRYEMASMGNWNRIGDKWFNLVGYGSGRRK